MNVSLRQGDCWPDREQEWLLKAALLSDREALWAWERWSTSVDIDDTDAGSYRLLPLLYRNLKKQGVEHPMMARLKGIYRKTWCENQLLFYRISALLAQFNRIGIPTLVLKGVPLVLLYYQDYGLRPMSDIDVLIPPDKLPTAMAALQQGGWKPAVEIPSVQRLLDSKHFHSLGFHNQRGEEFDLHWYSLFDSCNHHADKLFWQNSIAIEVSRIPTRALDATDELFYTCVHGVRWNVIPPFRWVADAATIARSSNFSIDWKRILDAAIERHLVLHMRDTLDYLKDLLNIPVPHSILTSLLSVPVSKREQMEYMAKTKKLPDRSSENQFLTASLTLSELRSLRMKIARKWLNLSVSQLESACKSDWGELHFQFLNENIFFLTPIGEEVDTPIGEEVDFVRELAIKIERFLTDDRAILYRLAAMLYAPAYRWKNYHVVPVPLYLLNCFIVFETQSRQVFKTSDDLDGFIEYRRSRTQDFYRMVRELPTQNIVKEMAHLFAIAADFSILKLSQENLQATYQQRSEIVKFALTNLGHSLEFDFDLNSPRHQKIRLGILLELDNTIRVAELSMLMATIESLDRQRFEIFLYSFGFIESDFDRYCQNFVDRLISLPRLGYSVYANLYEQSRSIRDDRLDILLFASDLTAKTTAATALAYHRLAPVQVASVVSSVPPKIDTIDFYIQGDLTVADSESKHSDRLATIAGSGYYFNSELFGYPSMSIHRHQLGIDVNAVVFTCGTNWDDITPGTQRMWTKIIASVPNSILMLQSLQQETQPQSLPARMFSESMNFLFDEYHLDRKRLIFPQSSQSRSIAISSLKIADIYLDTYPVSDAYSVASALFLGLPVVTLTGDVSRSRSGSALLQELGITDGISGSESDYINIATLLARNWDLRQKYCQSIQERILKAPFLDRRAYGRKIGDLLEHLYLSDRQQHLFSVVESTMDPTKVVIF